MLQQWENSLLLEEVHKPTKHEKIVFLEVKNVTKN